MLKYSEDWEYNVIGIYNYKKAGPFDVYFDFVRQNHHRLEGDIVESGVFRGSSLLSMALLLKEVGSNKKVYGFDSFSGFPPVYHAKDDLTYFKTLLEQGAITSEHYARILYNKELREWITGNQATVRNLSSSGDFSGTNIDSIRRKAERLGLDNIVLIDGAFHDTMTSAQKYPEKIMAVLMDCDLYQSYLDTFSFTWPRLVTGGLIYLDEYYSLKFPGTRAATNEFLAQKSVKPTMAPLKPGDFERWYIVKGEK